MALEDWQEVEVLGHCSCPELEQCASVTTRQQDTVSDDSKAQRQPNLVEDRDIDIIDPQHPHHAHGDVEARIEALMVVWVATEVDRDVYVRQWPGLATRGRSEQ